MKHRHTGYWFRKTVILFRKRSFVAHHNHKTTTVDHHNQAAPNGIMGFWGSGAAFGTLVGFLQLWRIWYSHSERTPKPRQEMFSLVLSSSVRFSTKISQTWTQVGRGNFWTVRVTFLIFRFWSHPHCCFCVVSVVDTHTHTHKRAWTKLRPQQVFLFPNRPECASYSTSTQNCSQRNRWVVKRIARPNTVHGKRAIKENLPSGEEMIHAWTGRR